MPAGALSRAKMKGSREVLQPRLACALWDASLKFPSLEQLPDFFPINGLPSLSPILAPPRCTLYVDLWRHVIFGPRVSTRLSELFIVALLSQSPTLRSLSFWQRLASTWRDFPTGRLRLAFPTEPPVIIWLPLLATCHFLTMSPLVFHIVPTAQTRGPR